jgi:hypothetical protein
MNAVTLTHEIVILYGVVMVLSAGSNAGHSSSLAMELVPGL